MESVVCEKSCVFGGYLQSSSTPMAGIGLKRPVELAFDDALCRKSGESWNPPLILKKKMFKEK